MNTRNTIFSLLVLAAAVGSAAAQVTVSPDNISAYSQGATSAYLTFTNVAALTPAEATWCGDVVSAAPDIGQRCDPATIFGVLPARYDQSRLNGSRYTDIMSITPVVARRAYTDAVRGNDARFFYVKHFVSTNGGPDQFVPVTIRLSGNGAGVPFSVTAVKLMWQKGEKIVPFIKPEEKLPAITAEIRYTGTGRLKGRWEIVRPGEELPNGRDLLSEAALPIEERGTQRRYTFLSRFNVDLPPGGRFLLPGPENWRIDKSVEGMYVLIFRVEASDAADSASNIGGQAIAAGAVAGFQLPTLKYYVGNSSNTGLRQITGPPDDLDAARPIVLKWKTDPSAKLYRIEVRDEQGANVFSAIALTGATEYALPSFVRELAAAKRLKWSLISIGTDNAERSVSEPADVK